SSLLCKRCSEEMEETSHACTQTDRAVWYVVWEDPKTGKSRFQGPFKGRAGAEEQLTYYREKYDGVSPTTCSRYPDVCRSWEASASATPFCAACGPEAAKRGCPGENGLNTEIRNAIRDEQLAAVRRSRASADRELFRVISRSAGMPGLAGVEGSAAPNGVSHLISQLEDSELRADRLEERLHACLSSAVEDRMRDIGKLSGELARSKSLVAIAARKLDPETQVALFCPDGKTIDCLDARERLLAGDRKRGSTKQETSEEVAIPTLSRKTDPRRKQSPAGFKVGPTAQAQSELLRAVFDAPGQVAAAWGKDIGQSSLSLDSLSVKSQQRLQELAAWVAAYKTALSGSFVLFSPANDPQFERLRSEAENWGDAVPFFGGDEQYRQIVGLVPQAYGSPMSTTTSNYVNYLGALLAKANALRNAYEFLLETGAAPTDAKVLLDAALETLAHIDPVPFDPTRHAAAVEGRDQLRAAIQAVHP
ncbi:MAG: hypothetical protein AAFU79_25725, partial [Myxococcota bacterium]